MTRETRTLINRDPFAREELHRERVHLPAGTPNEHCAWCGRMSCSPLSKVPYLFRYTIETDGGRRYPDARLFCCLPCRRAYNAH